MEEHFPTPKARQELLTELSRHIVAFAWSDKRCEPKPGRTVTEQYDVQAFLATAFVISIREHWILLTAGHVLKQLKKRLSAGRRLLKTKLIDMAPEENHFPSIPFDFKPEMSNFIDDRETNLDFGVIPLSQMYVELLKAGGTVPISESMVPEKPGRADGYLMAGLPRQARSIDVSSMHGGGLVRYDIGATVLPVYPTDDVPEVLLKGVPRFYARVPIGTGDEENGLQRLTDIDGMSGSPIFAYTIDESGKHSYALVALQSGWDGKARVLAANFVAPLTSILGSLIDQAKPKLAAIN